MKKRTRLTVAEKKLATPMTPDEIVALLKTETAPLVDWTVTSGVGAIYFDLDQPYTSADDGVDPSCRWISFKRGDVTVSLSVLASKDRWQRDYLWHGCVVEGNTFLGSGCFTRRGIDVSCCGLRERIESRHETHYRASIVDVLADEWERCERSKTLKATAVAIPTLPFTRQPAWIEKAKTDLASGRSVTLTPHGFGVGYVLSTRSGRDVRHSKPAASELKAFFGRDDLRIASIDCD